MQNRNLQANLRLSANLMPKSILKRVSDLADVKLTHKSITIQLLISKKLIIRLTYFTFYFMQYNETFIVIISIFSFLLNSRISDEKLEITTVSFCYVCVLFFFKLRFNFALPKKMKRIFMMQLRKREKVNWLKGWIIRFVCSKQSCKENQLEQR